MAKIIKESTAIFLILTLLFQNVFFSDHKAFNTINYNIRNNDSYYHNQVFSIIQFP